MLADAEKRARYDRFGHQGVGMSGPGPGDFGDLGGFVRNDLPEHHPMAGALQELHGQCASGVGLEGPRVAHRDHCARHRRGSGGMVGSEPAAFVAAAHA